MVSSKFATHCLCHALVLICIAASAEGQTYSETLQLAKVGWRTGDLTNAAFIEDSRMGDVVAVETADVFSTSSQALQALSAGLASVFLECWQSNRTPCSSTPGTDSSLLGIVGESSLYVSKSLIKRGTRFTDLQAFKNGSHKMVADDLRVIGSVRGWDEGKQFENFLLQEGLQDLLDRIEHFDSQADLDKAIVTSMKKNSPLLFTYFEPAAIPVMYQVVRVSIELPVLRKFFPQRPLYKVWRNDIGPRAVQEIENFQMDKGQMQGLLIDLAARSSVTKFEQSDPSYIRAVQVAAANRTCVLQGKMSSCELGDRWPRSKAPNYPAKVYVAMNLCPGFVGVLDDTEVCGDGEQMQDLKTKSGYSVDHMYEVFQNLGYARKDIIVRCGSSTDSILQAAARDIVDVAVACISIKEARQALVDFSTAYYTTGYRLLVRKVATAASEKDPYAAFLVPFTGQVWATFGIMVILLGICLTIIEKQAVGKFVNFLTFLCSRAVHPKKHDGVTLSSRQKMAVFENSLQKSRAWTRKRIDEEAANMKTSEMIEDTVMGLTERTKSLVLHKHAQKFKRTEEVLWQAWCRALVMLLRSIAFVFTFLVGRDAYAEAMESQAAKLVANLFVLLGTFLMALYTAKLAAFMTASSVTVGSITVSSLHDKGSVVVVLCTHECQTNQDCQGNDTRQYLLTHFPMLSVECVYNYRDLATHVIEGKVDAALHEETVLHMLASGCNELTVAGEAFGIQEFAYALPKMSVFTQGVSAAVTHLRMSGIHEGLHKKHVPTCESGRARVNEEGLSSGSLTQDDMRGLLSVFSIMLVSLVCFACLHHCVTKYLCKKPKTERHGGEDETTRPEAEKLTSASVDDKSVEAKHEGRLSPINEHSADGASSSSVLDVAPSQQKHHRHQAHAESSDGCDAAEDESAANWAQDSHPRDNSAVRSSEVIITVDGGQQVSNPEIQDHVFDDSQPSSHMNFICPTDEDEVPTIPSACPAAPGLQRCGM